MEELNEETARKFLADEKMKRLEKYKAELEAFCVERNIMLIVDGHVHSPFVAIAEKEVRQ